MLFEIDVSDVVNDWRNQAIPALVSGLAYAVRDACADGAREAVNSRLYQDRTAQLTASIHGDEPVAVLSDGAEGTITAGETYASYVSNWERTKTELSFLDHAEAKAESSLTEGISKAAEAAERAFNRK